MKRAVFIDRDGTLIEEREYLRRPEEVVLLAGVANALGRLQEAGFLLVLVTNQSGVGRGYFQLSDVAAVHERLRELLALGGVRLEKIYVAPEAPDAPAVGRKPSPRFLWEARDELGVELKESYMIGDKLSDLECGWQAGVRAAILVRTGYGTQTEAGLSRTGGPLVVVDDLAAASNWILES